jgi:hypothetical protein
MYLHCTVIGRKNRETGVKGDGVKPQQVRIILIQGVRSDRLLEVSVDKPMG